MDGRPPAARLLFENAPGHAAWDQDGYRLDDYREFTLTERRRGIMQPPNIGDRPRTNPEHDTTPRPQPF